VNRAHRTRRILLAPAALLAAALFLLVARSGPAAPTAAPNTLDLGKGPTVVVVHDLGGSRLSWMPTARKLIGSYHVVLVDLPGHGGSALPDPFTFEAAAEALDLVLAKQNPDSTVLVGKGMGGMLLLQDLKAHPNRARGLILIDAGLKAPMKLEDSEEIKWFNEMLDTRYDDFVKMVYARAGRDSLEGLRIRAMIGQVPPVTMKAYYRTIFTADVSPAFKSVKQPVLFLATDRLFKGGRTWGAISRDLGFDDSTSVAVRRLPGSSTLVMQDMPDSLAAVISNFATQVMKGKK
jgi:pimeloyl-ACP methyl ester carboxylesterase